jgi:hypothetical protein
VKKLEKAVDGLSQRAGPLLSQWEKMDVVPELVNGVWVSPFEAKLPKGKEGMLCTHQVFDKPLTLVQVHQLRRKPMKSLSRTRKSLRLPEWILWGLFN